MGARGEPSSRATEGEVSSPESPECRVVERADLFLNFPTGFRTPFPRVASSATVGIHLLSSFADDMDFSSADVILLRIWVSGTSVASDAGTEDRRFASLSDRREGCSETGGFDAVRGARLCLLGTRGTESMLRPGAGQSTGG